MFFVNESTRNEFASLVAGQGMSCYEVVELPSFSPVYLIEMPIFDDDGELEARKPLMVNSIDSVISLKNMFESALESVGVWMFFPAFMMNKGEGWQVQRINSIWAGTWQFKKDAYTCTKVELANGESIQLIASRPIGRAKVTWVKVL
nr:hypothetical protein [uncultured Deefgea sp.]